MFTVYVHKFPNEKVYVGITSGNVYHRWGPEGKGYSSQKLMWRAIQKYGWNNIEHTIVAENVTKEDACNMEIDLIMRYDSTNPNKGYNVATGGEFNSGFHFTHTDEAKKKISEAGKGRVISDKQRRQVSAVHKGKHLSDETKRKLSNSISDIMDDTYKAKISESIKNKWKNGDYDSAVKRMKGRVPWNKGKTKYNDDRLKKLSYSCVGRKHTEETKKKISESGKGRPAPNRRKVQCIETGEVFNSIREAVEMTHITAISKALRTGCNVKGTHWRYIDD